MISKRASSLAPSATMKITGLAKQMKREGRDVISLSAGEPDFKTPDYICEAAKKAIDDGHHGYTMNPGMPELREAIAAKLKRDNNLDYSPAEIVVSNGAKQSVGFSVLAVVDKGDEVIIPAPYWVSYTAMTELAQGTPVVVRTAFENDFKITPEQLEGAITDKTKALILCSPSNPTGSSYSAEELRALADVLVKYPGVVVISDEIYEYIVFESKHVGIAEVAPELRDRILVVNGFSKGFAMTGWRLGYVAGPKEMVGAVAKIQSQETSAPSSISQMAGIAAYTNDLSAVEAMRDSFKERRDFVVAGLNAINGVSCFTPGGAFYAFPDVSAHFGKTAPDGTTISTSTDLCLYLLENVEIATVPGDAFGEPNGIRLSYAISMDELKEALKRLKHGLEALS